MSAARVYEIPVCTRCHSKKIRCDPGRPRCSPCARAGTACEYVLSPGSSVCSSREHICDLESRLHMLEIDLALSQLAQKHAPSASSGSTLKLTTVVKLIRNYFCYSQFPYPILIEDEFIKQVDQIRSNHGDLYANADTIPDKVFFMINMAMSISLLSLIGRTPRADSLAEYAYTRAMNRLGRILVAPKDDETVQCVLLLVLYSMRHDTDLVSPGCMSEMAIQICLNLGFHSEGHSSESRRWLYLTAWSMDQCFKAVSVNPDNQVYAQFHADGHYGRKLMHYIQLQKIIQKIRSELYISGIFQREIKDSHKDPTQFIVNTTQQLEEWKLQTQHLDAMEPYTASWWHLWYLTAELHLSRPFLKHPTRDLIQLQRCYSVSTAIIDISFTQIYIRSHFLATYSWNDAHNIILAGATLLYIVYISKEMLEKDMPFIRRRITQWNAVVKRIFEHWPRVARAQMLLQCLATHTLQRFLPRGTGALLEEERQRPSKRSRMMSSSQLDCQRSVSASPEEERSSDLPIPVAKVRSIISQDKLNTQNTASSGFANEEEVLLPSQSFISENTLWILSIILGINSSENLYEGYMAQSSDGTDDYHILMRLLDELHLRMNLVLW
ncbi:hypothetical protein BGW36DRAFT_382970 [Talaromyces proteolyticus]|uniref:Zn(2)-C6 fungal-type domain-containing protein n=1 Tax=Talaromyces proteolyticus TaxID=1131652 RepID=A0AAD4PZD7_9EURO|nr:uncharacterized protein BGW36DRAFT_382970 [Talaromyces proteolyticus]KAH8695579.1 hypothetical protein BGW36DRAFT_382970 [Talaromyces proteolyticus]